MKDVNFGISTQFQHLVQKEPSIALRGSTTLVTWGEADSLYYRIGKLQRASVEFSSTGSVARGVQSSCGLARSQGRQGNLYAIEIHKSPDIDGDNLTARVGRVDDSVVQWKNAPSFAVGKNPAVAINDQLYAVEVHSDRDGESLRYHVGSVTVQRNDEKVTFPAGNGTAFATGKNPAVAVNDAGGVLLAWESTGSSPTIRIKAAQLTSSNTALGGFGAEQTGPAGSDPALALDNDGTAILMYRDPAGKLRHLVGRQADTPIFPAGVPGTEFEPGRRASVASHGGTAAQIHQSPGDALFYSTSLVTDRSRWMGDRFGQIRDNSLAELALSASHDAGLYRLGSPDPSGAALAQSLDLFGQLSQGIRYFDLRPRWNAKARRFDIFHDIDGFGDILGPTLSEVLGQVARFIVGRQELVILKFSHYAQFDAAVDADPSSPGSDPATGLGAGERASARYRAMTQLIENSLGVFFYKKPGSETSRLATIPLRTLFKDRHQNRGIVLVVCDGVFPTVAANQVDGIYVYRDVGADKGDLQVYDQYYSTAGNFPNQLVIDQKSKFDNYRAGDADLFLLSWTLTPPPSEGGETVLNLTTTPNRNLADAVNKDFVRNGHQQIVNLVYTNYADSARATDVCLYLNGVPQPAG